MDQDDGYSRIVLVCKNCMMKLFDNVSYDPQANAFYITVYHDRKVADTIIRDDVMLDVDDTGDIVGIEILNADKHHAMINRLLLSKESI
jgi:uncharacterized protein YuzE